MKRLTLICMLTLIRVVGYSQTDTLSRETIAQLKTEQKAMFDLFSNGDVEEFKRLAGDDYLSINADGTYMNKTQALELIPKFKGSRNELVEQTDRIYNNLAVSTGRVKFYLGSFMVADIYFTQTWIYRDNRWQFISWQGTTTGSPKNYPIYMTLICLVFAVGLVALIRKLIRRKKKLQPASTT